MEYLWIIERLKLLFLKTLHRMITHLSHIPQVKNFSEELFSYMSYHERIRLYSACPNVKDKLLPFR